jgi:hypothetical protein
MDRPYLFHKSGNPMKQTPNSRVLISISFGGRCKGVLPPRSPHTAPTETDAPLLEPSFIHPSKSPVQDPPSRFPSETNKEGHARLQGLFHYPPGFPVKKSPLQVSLTVPPKRRRSVSRNLLQLSLRVASETRH